MDLSILLVQYRPDEGELRRTLASLLRQSCRCLLYTSAVGLGGVLDDLEAVGVGNGVDLVHRGALAVEVLSLIHISEGAKGRMPPSGWM